MGNHKGISKFQITVVLSALLLCVAMGIVSRQTGGESAASPVGAETQTDRQNVATATTAESGGAPETTESESVAPKTAESESAAPVQSGLFYFEMLSDEEKQVYQEVYASVTSGDDRDLSTKDTQLVDRVYQFVLWDHPEIFYTNGYNLQQQLWNDKVIKLTLQPIYQMSWTEVENNRAFIDSYIAAFRAALPQGLDTYGKIKFVYEYLINGTEYQLGCENSQNICSVFILHKSVCAGYTKATQYLLRELGIPATVVHGTVNGEGHAWNLVWVDGIPYYLDTTWGDASYTFSSGGQEAETAKIPPVSYDYFLITEQDLLTTHRIDHPEYYPDVTATEYNYYRHEGLYFEDYDTEKLSGAFDRAYAQGQQSLTIRCATPALLLSMKESLLDDQKIFDYVKVSDRFYYNINDSMCTMTFWLE